MIDHITIRAADRDTAADFYRLALELLNGPDPEGEEYLDWGDFSIARASTERPATRRLHIAFQAIDRDHVDAWWHAMRDAGHPDLGAPAPRPQYSPTYYGAFVADPGGNSIEAVHHQPKRTDGTAIDHLWIRVHDLDASTRFYTTVAPTVGYHIRTRPEITTIHRDHAASFSLVRGEPTESLHLAFGVDDDSAVDAFHRAGREAGYTSLGEPGERPHYHPGYYGAFLADPDRNSIEAVHHKRQATPTS